MEERNNGKLVAVIALCVAIIGLSVGFAALSTNLTINGTATVGGTSWNIHYAEKDGGTENYVATPGVTRNDNLPVAGTVTLNTATTEFTISGARLVSPGDRIVYNFNIKNDGDFKGAIGAQPAALSVTCTSTGTTVYENPQDWCNANITATYTYEDDTEFALNDPIETRETKGTKLTLTYNANSSAESLLASDQTITITVSHTMNYVQSN